MSTMTFLQMQQELAAYFRMDQTNSDHATLLKRWLNQSQQEIRARHDWSFALDREIVQTVADKTAGTVSISAGGTSVSGSSTSFASGDVGKFIQFSSSNDWYKITGFTDATTITIEKPYIETSALSAGTYIIRQFFYSLSSSVEKVLDMRQMSSPRKLTMVHFRDLDKRHANGTATGKASSLALWGYDSSNNWQFMIYPAADAIFNIEIRFKKKATDMSADDDVSAIPEKWHTTTLMDGAMYRGLEYVRTDHSDRRADVKKAHFEQGIAQMMADSEPEADYHPVMQSSEAAFSISDVIRFPESYDPRH